MNEIILGDCISVMSNMPGGTFDLCITSCPYRAGKDYEDDISIEQYKKFASDWVSLIPGLLKPNGQFWLNVGYTKTGSNTTLPLTYLYYPLIGMPMIQEIVWHYEGGMAYKKRFTHRTERWMWFAKDPENITFNLDAVRDLAGTKYINDKRNNPLGRNPTDYWKFDRVVGGNGKGKEKTSHPCQFPSKMIERIIKACSNAGDNILDPFSGSGTVAFVAKKLSRNYLGIEKEEAYVKESLERISGDNGILE